MDKDKKLGANKTIYIFKLISHENTSEQATASNYRVGQLQLPKKKSCLKERSSISIPKIAIGKTLIMRVYLIKV